MKLANIIKITCLLLVSLPAYSNPADPSSTPPAAEINASVVGSTNSFDSEVIDKHIEQFLSLYDKRISEALDASNRRLDDFQKVVDTKIESLRNEIHSAVLIIAAITALFGWVGYKTLSAWIKQAIKRRVEGIVSQQYIDALLLKLGQPAIESMLKDFENKALVLFEQMKEKQINWELEAGEKIKAFDQLAKQTLEQKKEKESDLQSTGATEPNASQNEGMQLIIDGDFEQAHKVSIEAFKVDRSAGSLGLAAKALGRMGRLKEAETYYRLALGMEPNDSNLLIDLADTLIDQNKNSDEALDLLNRSISIEEDSFAYALKADLHANRGEFDEADQAYEKSLQLNSESQWAIVKYAIHLQNNRKNIVEAEKLLIKAVEMKEDAWTLTKYAQFIEEVYKDDAKEESLLLRAIKQDSNSKLSLFQYALLLTRLETRNKEALAVWEKLLEIDADSQYIKDRVAHLKTLIASQSNKN